jgi:hypothetical protein
LFSQQDSSQNKKADNFLRINYDNDLFSQTDRYYTQGIYFEFISPVIKKSPLTKILIPAPKTSQNCYGIKIEHCGYTPRSILHDSIYFGERPYAATFILSHFLTSISKEKRIRLTTKIDLGVIGPLAKGKEMQKQIHYWTNNAQPLGWQYQIANDFVLNYELNLEKGIFTGKYFEAIVFSDVRVGTLYDDIGAGAMVRTGKMFSYFENLGMTKSKENKKDFQCYFFAKGKVKAVGYNATMQGGMFNQKSIYTIPSSDIKRVVGIFNVGIVVAYKTVSAEFSKTFLSPEFKGGLDHSWGHCNVTICF